MKIWKDFRLNAFDWFGRWERLQPGTRRLFLEEIGSNLKVDPQVFSEEVRRELLDAGFMQPGKQRLKEEVRRFRNLARSMYRHRHFDWVDPTLSVDYVSDHLTNWDCSDLPSLYGSRQYGRNANSVAKDVVESSWLKAFIDCASVEEYEIDDSLDSQHYLSGESFELLQRWIQRLLGSENPLPMAALLEEAGGDVGLSNDALRGAIRYMLLFPALEGERLLPVVGLWPAIRERMTRPKAEAPAAGGLPEGCQVYDVPLLLHDMTAILVAASGGGLRLKGDGVSLFKKEEALIEGRMLPDPPAECGYEPPYPGRISHALDWLGAMKLVVVRGPRKGKRLEASEKGRAWLAGADGERLKALHEHMHAARKRHAGGTWSHYHELVFVPHNPQSHVSKGERNLEDSVVKAFAECPVGEWIGLDGFLKWQAESENPFMLSLDASIERIFYSSWSNTDSFREERWRGLLADFMYERLLPLGGIRLAFNGEGDILFSMTPAGAYLIGARDGFEYAVESAAGGVLVQPDFEVIFTAPNPHAEGELTRFCERIGNGVGALFRITRTSVLHALDSGQTGGQICAILEAQCATAVPANVVKQIQGWSDAFRRVAIRQILVVECPDVETALLVCGLFPKKVSRLTDTLVQIEGTNKTLEPLKKKLRKNGIGIA